MDEKTQTVVKPSQDTAKLSSSKMLNEWSFAVAGGYVPNAAIFGQPAHLRAHK